MRVIKNQWQLFLLGEESIYPDLTREMQIGIQRSKFTFNFNCDQTPTSGTSDLPEM